MNRRTALKAIGGFTVAATGAIALSGGGAAAEANITATDPATVSNDTGAVSEVFIKPEVTLNWSGFDEPVEHVRTLVEAKHGGQSRFWPVYRETPWLTNGTYWPEKNHQPGTSGSYQTPLFSRASELASFDFESEPDLSQIPRVVLFADAHPRPDYVADYDESYLSGQNIRGGGNYLNGSYGTAGAADVFDVASDGTTAATTVDLRFTFSLRKAEDHSPLVMDGEDGYPDHDETGPDPYADLQSMAADHPAVLVETASFDVTTENVAASGTPTGSTNAGAN